MRLESFVQHQDPTLGWKIISILWYAHFSSSHQSSGSSITSTLIQGLLLWRTFMYWFITFFIYDMMLIIPDTYKMKKKKIEAQTWKIIHNLQPQHIYKIHYNQNTMFKFNYTPKPIINTTYSINNIPTKRFPNQQMSHLNHYLTSCITHNLNETPNSSHYLTISPKTWRDTAPAWWKNQTRHMCYKAQYDI